MKFSSILVENSGQSSLRKEIERDMNVSPDIQIAQEGGSYVDGVMATLGVKAVNGQGEMIGRVGEIVDDRNNVVTSFEFVSPGYGKAYFTPQADRKYRLKIDSGSKVFEKELPDVEKKGYSLNLKERPDYIVVSMANTNEDGLNGCVLLAHSGETPLAVYNLDAKEKEVSKFIRINKAELGDGVVSFSLFDQAGNAKCQRSLRLGDDVASFVGLQADKDVYKKGEVIVLKIKNGKNIMGDVSMSVVSKERTIGVDGQKDFLLEGDAFVGSAMPLGLKDENFVRRKEMLDAMMILDSVHVVNWEKINHFELDEVVHKPELGIMVSGTVDPENKGKASETSVLMTVGGGRPFQEATKTNDKGGFEFGPYEFYDSLDVLVHVKKTGARQLSEDVDIDVFDKWPKFEQSGAVTNKRNVNAVSSLGGKQLSKNELSGLSGEVTLLDEVVVQSEFASDMEVLNKELDKLTPYYSYSKRIVADSSKFRSGAISAMDLLVQIPGVVVNGSYPNQRILIRGVGSINESIGPLFLVNGAPTSDEVVKQMMADEVMFVDVIKGAGAAAFGARGGNGVVAFYTKRGNMSKVGSNGPVNWVNATIPGFSRARSFEDYVKSSLNEEGDSNRSLLYWNPAIALDEDSIVRVDTEQAVGTYSVVLKGLDKNGDPIHVEKTIEIIE